MQRMQEIGTACFHSVIHCFDILRLEIKLESIDFVSGNGFTPKLFGNEVVRVDFPERNTAFQDHIFAKNRFNHEAQRLCVELLGYLDISHKSRGGVKFYLWMLYHFVEFQDDKNYILIQ
jgi:hypothetical protein